MIKHVIWRVSHNSATAVVFHSIKWRRIQDFFQHVERH